jgi:hypothetical protein
LKVSENKILRRIFGPKKEEVQGGWRKPHNELHNFYASPHVIRVIKSRRLSWRKGEMQAQFLTENFERIA